MMTKEEIFQSLKDLTLGWYEAASDKMTQLKSLVTDWFSARRSNVRLEELQEIVEDWFFTKEAVIRQAQMTSLGLLGKHVQCYELCQPPIDGNPVKLSSVGGNWDLLNIDLGDVPCSMEIHEYQDSRGNGFLVSLKLKTADGKVYRKIRNYGPATELSQEWEYLPEESL